MILIGHSLGNKIRLNEHQRLRRKSQYNQITLSKLTKSINFVGIRRKYETKIKSNFFNYENKLEGWGFYPNK